MHFFPLHQRYPYEPRLNTQEVLWKISRHGSQRAGPAIDRADSSDGARRSRAGALQLGDAVFPGGGKQYGFFALPQVGAGVWVEFEQGDPQFPHLVRLLVWRIGRTSGGGAAGSAADSRHRDADDRTEHHHGEDVPGPTGGIIIKTLTGALISVNDTVGITISNGKGASILLAGPSVIINAGALVVT